MNDSCGCCAGLEKLTPLMIANRPGLEALRYRAGTHATFLETMLARLSGKDYPALASLTTREHSDPAIAMLDAWATVADVLTFYQERIANEGYLRTATERRSILELARLVGYTLRPGVAASVYLAYTLDDKAQDEVIIPKGARVQSVPGQGELPQTFETSEDLKARWEWSALKPRLTKPQEINSTTNTIYLQGINTNLKPNDPLLFVLNGVPSVVRRVLRLEVDAKANRTKVVLTIKGEIDLDLDGLIGSIQPGQIPEEEGPYSVVIGDRAAKEVKQSVNDIVRRLQNQTQSPDALIRAINVQIPLLEQTIRIYKALNFDVLAAWATRVRQQLESIVRQLRMRPPGEPPPAKPVDLDTTKVRELLDKTPHRSPKPFGKEIGEEETKSIKQSLEELLCTLADSQINNADKVLAAQAALLRLQQYSYIFDKLGFTEPTNWVNSLRDLLAAAVPQIPDGGTMLPIPKISPLPKLISPFLKLPYIPPPSSRYLKRDVGQLLLAKMDISPQLLVNMLPRLKVSLYQAWRNARVVTPGAATIYALRATAAVFGYNAPLKMALKTNTGDSAGQIPFIAEPDDDWSPTGEDDNKIFLDNAYEAIVPGSYIVIQKPGEGETETPYRVAQVSIHPRTAYGISSKTTEIQLPEAWWNPDADGFDVVRGTVVYAQSENLALAEEPIESPLGPDSGDPQAAKRVELDGLYDGLASGQWLIVSGERVGDEGSSGVEDAELVMLAMVEQSVNAELHDNKTHTTAILANDGLAFKYKRDTVTIYANVVKASHGETRAEVLGSGDGSQSFQFFVLKQPPLTFVAAPNPSGVESTLVVRVNDVQWHEQDAFSGLGPTDRAFITKTDDESKTTIIFGNGQEGARLPTGVENVRAVYRHGIGKAGNVRAKQISLLMTRPLGVKEVINPLPASGGADKESRDQARQNAPLAVMALDRLVSVQDYADFTRTFAGIGKASAARLSAGGGEIVHLTIAGADDIPIEEHSDLYRNLTQALRRYGDPYQPFQVKMRQLLLLIIEASVRLLPDYQWESVEPKIRSALLDAFGFERRNLGQDVLYSEVLSVIQAVPGVAYVDLDTLDAASEADVQAFLDQEKVLNLLDFLAKQRRKRPEVPEEQPRRRIPAHLARRDSGRDGGIAPAQLVILRPEVPDILILKEIPV